MRTRTRPRLTVVATAVLTAALASGVAAQDIEGNVRISGSSTVEPISLAVAEYFNELNPNWTYSVEGPGTTTGFEQFCNGETDISNASRAIKDVEIENCAAGGVDPVELNVAIDGLAVIVSTQNDAATCFDFTDLYAIFGAESSDIRTWEEAAAFAAELGSETTDWPSGDLAITAPGDESGTWGSFIEIALEDIQDSRAAEGIEAAAGEPNTRRPGDVYVASPNDNVIIDGVGGNPNGIGFVGYAFALNNFDRVRMLEIAGEDGTCVAPTEETVASNEYPISRDLFIYVDQARLDPTGAGFNAAVPPYVDFYLTEDGQDSVSGVGYVQLAEGALQDTRATWDAARTPTGSTD